MWAQKEEKKFWLEWLNRYKNLRCLWDEDAKRQASKYDRNKAYQELADLAKSINPEADFNFVRSRINTFRTGYRREYKKVEAAKANGISYTPSLFYFDTLKQFVNPEFDEFDNTKTFYDDGSENELVSTPKPKHSSTNNTVLKNDSTKSVLGKFFSSDFDTAIAESENTRKRKISSVSTVNKNDKTSSDDYDQVSTIERKYEPAEETGSVDYDDFESSYQVKTSSKKPLESTRDEYAILGKRIAEHFRNMKQNQRLIAEKIISDVCIYGRMEKLTMESSLIVESSDSHSDTIDYENPDTYIYNT